MPQCQPHSACKTYGPSFAGFKNDFRECSKIWPSLSPPREVGHTNSPVLCLSWKNVKTASLILGNHPFFGPVNFLCDASHPLIAALRFDHSRTLLSSTAKIAATLQFSFSAHQITSRLNFAIYDSLLDFWRPSITTVHDKLE
jgi:hypothetical protein